MALWALGAVVLLIWCPWNSQAYWAATRKAEQAPQVTKQSDELLQTHERNPWPLLKRQTDPHLSHCVAESGWPSSCGFCTRFWATPSGG